MYFKWKNERIDFKYLWCIILHQHTNIWRKKQKGPIYIKQKKRKRKWIAWILSKEKKWPHPSDFLYWLLFKWIYNAIWGLLLNKNSLPMLISEDKNELNHKRETSK